MTEPSSILCVGYMNWDIAMHVNSIPDPDFSEEITGMNAGCGGAATNTGLCLSTLGHNVHLASSIGTDEKGDRILSILDNQDITTYITRDGDTTTIYAQVTEGSNPRYYHWESRDTPVTPEQIPESAYKTVDHVHVTSFHHDHALTIANHASEHDATVSFNPTQGYDGLYSDVFDIMIMNEEEAEIFRSNHDWETATENTVIVMTNGAAGATVYAPDIDHAVSHPGFSPDGPVIDTIGAGDSFNAGFLDAWLRTGDYGASLAQANACGASAVTVPGAPDTLHMSKYHPSGIEMAGHTD